MTKRSHIWIRLLVLCAALGLMVASMVGCGDASIVDKQFECQDDQDCQKTHTCQNGKCIFADNDKDGFAKNKDCNDNNKEIYPGAQEICDNGADDNCDGRTDETPCACKDGAVRECGSDKGICKPGQQTCNAGAWSKCEGAVEPLEEACDGKDNDCDGNVDEGVPNCCQPKETKPCGSQIGTCKQGVQNCQLGIWTECIGAVGPEEETCDNKDNDCDGKIDNIKDKTTPLQQPCFSGPPENRKKGACKDGIQLCKAGKWSLCENDVLPEKEVCDDKDNDCDGQVDNIKGEDKILSRDCYSADPATKDKGVCVGGTQRCVGGAWSACLGEISPIAESCNGIDDDCDGQVDNTAKTTKPLGRACFSGPPAKRQIGECKDGIQECVNGRWQGCKGDVLDKPELCDGKDNDCDGRVDNNPGKQTPLSDACYSGSADKAGVGECKKGIKTCSNGKFTACSGDVLPAKETCDGKDNDCNGKIDDGIAGTSVACNTTGRGECKAGTRQCRNGALACIAKNTPITETCNGKDDDCDGQTDEGNLGGGAACIVPGKKGICVPGKRTCSGGKVICQQNLPPSGEVCNNKDDDCDGTTDEGASCARGRQCSSGTCNTCSQPSSRCSNYSTFCTKNAPSISCKCGFTSYCYQQSASIFCSGCCAQRRCH